MEEPVLSKFSRNSRGSTTASNVWVLKVNCHPHQGATRITAGSEYNHNTIENTLFLNYFMVSDLFLSFPLPQPRLRSMRRCRVSSSWCIAPVRPWPCGSCCVTTSSASLSLNYPRYSPLGLIFNLRPGLICARGNQRWMFRMCRNI